MKVNIGKAAEELGVTKETLLTSALYIKTLLIINNLRFFQGTTELAQYELF